jgi:hypothetical protein
MLISAGQPEFVCGELRFQRVVGQLVLTWGRSSEFHFPAGSYFWSPVEGELRCGIVLVPPRGDDMGWEVHAIPPPREIESGIVRLVDRVCTSQIGVPIQTLNLLARLFSKTD